MSVSTPPNDFQKVNNLHPIESPFEDSGNEKPMENIIINNDKEIAGVAIAVSNDNKSSSNNDNVAKLKSSVVVDNTNTLDESVSVTLKRDLFRIYTKLRYVIVPKLNRTKDDLTNLELKNWDLWGPLIFTLLLCM